MIEQLSHGPLLPFRRALGILGGVIISLAVIGYVLYQARLLIIGPEITLAEPVPITHHSQVVEVAGTARNITNITLNGRAIYTNESGYFKEAVILENGYTIATLEAVDRYGRSTSIVLPLVYQPQTLLPS